MNGPALYQNIKEKIESLDYIEKCYSVERCGYAAGQHVAVEMQANVPSNNVRADVMTMLEAEYPGTKFRLVFYSIN